MRTVTRRTLLAGTAAASVIAAIPGAASAQSWSSSSPGPKRPVPTVYEKHRVVVIGSGFAGGVAALRLAEAGIGVTLLERGRRWVTGPNANTFPSVSAPDKRLLWHRSLPEVFGRPVAFDPYVGLIETVGGANMTALCAAGLGGGSLLYQGMTLQPSKEVFNAHFPEDLDWDLMDRVHYPRVASMLNLQVAPDDVINSKPYQAARIFARNAASAGLPVSKIPMPIDWDYARRELRGEMKPSYTNGDGAFGVNNGGKSSIDVTYIKAAEATGKLNIQTCHEVVDITHASNGGWQVTANHTDEQGNTLERKVIETPRLIMAAGSLNTTKLLVKAGAEERIKDLPDALGQGWGTNGDRIYGWTNLREGFGVPQGGPVVYGTKVWDDPKSAHTVIQASIPPFNVDARTTIMVGYGVSDSRGSFRYNPQTRQAELQWPADGDRDLALNHIRPTAEKIAGRDGFLIDTNLLLNSTWHALGGASMQTVCDLEGRVFGHQGLYVLDGALMPGTTAACNPSMTIAAVAERAMDELLRTEEF